MEGREDKQWATKYLLDPLTAPEPSAETGAGASHIATASIPRKPPPSVSVHSTGNSEQTAPSVSVRSSNNAHQHSESNSTSAYPTPPQSASPRNEKFPALDGSKSNRNSSVSTQIPTSTGGVASSTAGSTTRSRRTSSLSQRHPGDLSHRPLDMLRQHDKSAHRSPHLRKKHHVGADSIDSLDNLTGSLYHHEGPYDATLLARNMTSKHAPIEAVARSNEEALRATPREKIQDSVDRHYPLDGVASVPPGTADRYGRIYRYQEGTDLMREGNPEGGAYKRYPGVQYHPDDLKGKGEPSYSVERALKAPHHQHGHHHRRNVSDVGAQNFEMRSPRSAAGARPSLQHRPSSADAVRIPEGQKYSDWEGGNVRRSESGAERLRKRLGALRI